MGITQTPSASGYSVPNWQLLQTSTPSGVSTVTFSGLSGYSKYRVLTNTAISAANQLQLRLNGDSGTNYNISWGRLGGTSSGGSTGAATQILLGSLTTGVIPYNIEIDHCLLSSPKMVMAQGFDINNNGYVTTLGTYITTSVLSSITILLAGGTFSSGSIYLYGAN